MIVRRLGKVNERVSYGVLGFVGLALVWEITANLGLYRRSLLSTPTAIWRAAVTDFGNGTIFPHIAVSLQEFAIGFFVSLIVAIPLGLAIGWFRRVDYATSALLAALNATPNVALIPLIVLVAGIGLESKVIVVFLSAFFAVMVTTTAGVQSIARRHLEITRSFGGSQWLAFRTVALPSTLPFILSGIRIGAGRALVAAAVGYADERGMDHVIVGVSTTGREANRFFARLGFAPLVVRRIAVVSALRRTLGLTDLVAEGRADAVRRRSLRRGRALTAPLPRPRPLRRS